MLYDTGNEREQRPANTGFASGGVTCLHSSSVFQFNFSAGLTVKCSEIPHCGNTRNLMHKAKTPDHHRLL
jgi:hypothetical protein